MEIQFTLSNKQYQIKFDIYLICIILVATILRIYQIGFQSAWLDEIHTLLETEPSLSLKEANEIIAFREGIPHLYFYLVRAFTSVFGHNIENIRIVSAMFSVGIVIVVYYLTKKLFSQNTAYFAAALTTIHPFLIEHAQDARVYSMLTFFIVLSYYFAYVLVKKPNLKNSILLGISLGFVVNSQPVGLLNIASIFFILLVFILMNKDRLYKINLFKFSFLSGIIFLALFSLAFKIIFKSAQMSSFWTGEATFNQLVFVLQNISGKTKLSLYILIISTLIYLVVSIFKKKDLNEKTSLIFISLWIFFNLGGIILKSFLDVSMLVDRYLIGLIPVLLIILAKIISEIKFKFIQLSLLFILITVQLYFFIYKNQYYSTIHKTQFDKITEFISHNNYKDHKVYSKWGWVLQYYFNKYNFKDIHEVTFEDYIKMLNDKNLPLESFWYLDGNIRNYNLNKEEEAFLNTYFKLVDDVKMHDTWARHYVLLGEKIDPIEMNNENNSLHLKDFIGLHFGGNVFYLFDGTKIESNDKTLTNGNYELKILANSLPIIPINGENARLVIKLNDEIIGDYFLSEKEELKEKIIPFTINSEGNYHFSLTFANDFMQNDLDRNIIFHKIELIKK